jgi:hypothetical protein
MISANMASYHCQICAIAMSVARIRTPDDPLDAAWNYKGHTYVGFGECQDIHGGTFPDQHGEQCTTLDRTPASLDEDIKKAGFPGALWPDEDDKDAEWLPEDDSDARSEVLEYDTEADFDVESLGISRCDDKDAGDGGNALRELHAPSTAEASSTRYIAQRLHVCQRADWAAIPWRYSTKASLRIV